MTYLSEVLADTPRVLWLLNETSGVALDASGNGITGNVGSAVVRNLPPVTRDGGRSYYFPGGASSVVIGSTAFPVQPDGRAYTVEAWVATGDAAGTGTGFRVLAGDMGSVAVNSQGALGLRDSVPEFFLYNTGSNPFSAVATGISVADQAIHHVVGVYEGSGTNVLRIYVDGVERGTATATGTVRGYDDFKVANSDNGALFPIALIDSPAFYETALSAPRVLAHYNAGYAVVTAASAQAAGLATEVLGTSPVSAAQTAGLMAEVLGDSPPASVNNAGLVVEVLGSISTTQAMLAAQQTEVLEQSPAPSRQVAGQEAVALLALAVSDRRLGGIETSVLTQLPATTYLGGLEVSVLLPVSRAVVTVGAPVVAVQVRWPDGSWHPVLAKGN